MHPPLKLMMILHFYSTRSPFPDPTFGSPAYEEFLKDLIDAEMITPYYNTILESDPVPHVYQTTSKGEVFVEALKNLPFPVLQYIMP